MRERRGGEQNGTSGGNAEQRQQERNTRLEKHEQRISEYGGRKKKRGFRLIEWTESASGFVLVCLLMKPFEIISYRQVP